MGTMVIQYAKLSGYEVITTCSPRNFALCKAYGADHIFDYNDESAPASIRALTKDSLKLCMDCISETDSAAFSALVDTPGSKYSGIKIAEWPRVDVETFKTLGYSFLGEEWEQFGVIHPPSKEDFEFSKAFAELGEKLLEEGKIKPHPVSLREGGLAAFPAAMDDLRTKKVSGQKLVLKV